MKLSKDDLGELLSKLYSVRSKWYNLGLGLGLRPDDLDAIDIKNAEPSDCLREVFKLWLSINPEKGDLIDALKTPPVGYDTLADELLGWSPSSPVLESQSHTSSVQCTPESAIVEHSDTEKKRQEMSASHTALIEDAKRTVTVSDSFTQTDSSSSATYEARPPLANEGLNPEQERLDYKLQLDVDKMKREFATLQTKIRLSLKRKGVSAQDIAAHVIGLGISQTNKELLRRETSLEQLFIQLTECWSFLDCDLLDSIVNVYGTKKDRSGMAEYHKKLKGFCERRVSELPANVCNSSKSQVGMLKRDQVIIKLNKNNPTLNDIKLVKKKICQILNVDPAALVIKDIKNGCVEVTFYIFEGVSKVLFPLSERQSNAFRSASIIRLSCGDYQERISAEQSESNGESTDNTKEARVVQGLESKPKLSELQRLVKPHVANRWEELGTMLGLADDDDGEQLDKIQESRNGDCGMCFNDAMKLWLRSGGSSQVTWATLIKVIKSIEGLQSVGAQIEAQLISSAVVLHHPTESTSPSQPICPTPQLPPTNGSPFVSASSLSTNEAIDLSNDDIATSSSEGTLSPTASSEEASQPEPEDPHEATMSETEAVPDSFDYTLKLDPGKQIYNYQSELARPGIDGKNYIVVAPPGSGKTFVAALVISKHLQKNQNNDEKPKVVFIVNTKPLAKQRKKELGQFIPGAEVGCSMGDGGPSIFDLLPHNDVIVCTAGKLLDAIKGRKVTFDKISLIVIDECHHTKKSSPQANVMVRYLECKAKDPSKVPQVMGLTASPGAGDNPHFDEKKTIDHLVNLCALMDATSGIKMVEENQQELDCNTNKPSFMLEIPASRREDEPFIQTIVREMKKCEQTVPNFKCSFPKWSQEYETIVQQLKQELEISITPEYRDQISTLRLLRCYSQALLMYMDLTRDDAISVLEEYTGLPADNRQATPTELQLKKNLHLLLITLKELDPIENPLLNLAKEKLTDAFINNPHSKGILFVRTKKHASSICKWIKLLPESNHFDIKPRVITGHTRETGAGMTQVEQEEVMKSFRESGCNLLVATSVAEEGLDVPACNLVIRFQHVSSEIARMQTLRRARAEESEGFTILTSKSRKKLQELKNDELLRRVELCMQWFPRGPHLITEIEKRQKIIRTHHQQKIAIYRALTSKHDPKDFQMRCKNCKIHACAGSDVYLIDGTFHHAVPDESFKEKIKKRPHKTSRQLTEQMAQTHKIFCANCDSEWGIMATWPAKGKEFPVLKCKQFIFESNGQPMSIKKWSDAPFALSELSVWFDLFNQSGSE